MRRQNRDYSHGSADSATTYFGVLSNALIVLALVAECAGGYPMLSRAIAQTRDQALAVEMNDRPQAQLSLAAMLWSWSLVEFTAGKSTAKKLTQSLHSERSVFAGRSLPWAIRKRARVFPPLRHFVASRVG